MGSKESVEIDPARFGAPMHFIQLDTPRFLSGKAIDGDLSFSGFVIHIVPSPDRFYSELEREYGAKAVTFTEEYQPVMFAQMLAKAAFGFAVARYSIGGIKKPYVIEAIDSGKDIGQWVGCLDDGQTRSTANDDIELQLGFLDTPTRDIAATIKLFGRLESPTYLVVVGEPRPDLLRRVQFKATEPPGLVSAIGYNAPIRWIADNPALGSRALE